MLEELLSGALRNDEEFHTWRSHNLLPTTSMAEPGSSVPTDDNGSVDGDELETVFSDDLNRGFDVTDHR
jgi:hypothetical protein